jgi:hypothetical protein
MNRKMRLREVVTITIFALCLFSTCSARAFVTGTYNAAQGSRFDIYSSQAGVDAFNEKPVVYIEISSYERIYPRFAKVIEPESYPCARITCEWTSAKTPPGTYKLWIQTRNREQTANPVLVSDAFSVWAPLITTVQRDASEVRRIIVTGRYFGAEAPLIWISYPPSNDENSSTRTLCPISRPLAFADGEGRAGESCMDVTSGESRVEFILPQEIPDSLALAVHVENRTGGDAATLEPMERDDLTIRIETSPETGGTTSPDGSIIVKPDEAVAVTAKPAQGFRFAGWEASGNMVVLNANLLSAVVTPKESGTVSAVFEAVQMEFDGIMSASAAIVTDPDSASVASSAYVTWNPAQAANTPESKIKYHIYLDDTDDIDLLYREENRVRTLIGETETSIPLNPVQGAVYYVLAVAEDESGNRNENHRPARVVNGEISFRKRIKDVGAIISNQSALRLSEDERELTLKNGDYWSSFANDDIILFDTGGKQFLDRVDLVYLEGDDTILWVEPVPFGDAIQFGEWSAESYAPDAQDSNSRENGNFTGTVDFGQGVTAHGRVIIEGLNIGFNTKFPGGSKNIAQAWLKGTLGFCGRLEMKVQGEASNNPGERKKLWSGKFISHVDLDGKKIKYSNNLIVDLFLDFRVENSVRFVQSVNIEKKFDVSIEIHSDKTYKVTDNSDDLVFDPRCSSSEFTDMEFYLNVRPRLVSSLGDKNPDEANLSLGLEEKILESQSGFAGYEAFNIIAGGSASYTYSAKNFWWPTEYHTKNFPGEKVPVFSLPFVEITGPGSLEQDKTGTFVMKWKNGINNEVPQSLVIWDCYHENPLASHTIKGGQIIKTEDGYERPLYFKTHTPGRWTITMSARGNGFLGEDLGVVYDSVTVYVYEPPQNREPFSPG